MMNKKMEEFQLGCKRMPKDLRGWDAFIELKRTVDDFLESLPLVEQLAHPSLRPRHWTQLMELTGKTLNVTSENFKLSTLLEAGLLDCAEDVEDIANSAVKELGIETKLAELSADWSCKTLTFAQFKNRGLITLNGGATAELMEALEETQMALPRSLPRPLDCALRATSCRSLQRRSGGRGRDYYFVHYLYARTLRFVHLQFLRDLAHVSYIPLESLYRTGAVYFANLVII